MTEQTNPPSAAIQTLSSQVGAGGPLAPLTDRARTKSIAAETEENSGTFRISRLAQLNRTDQPAVDLPYSMEESWKFGMSPIFPPR